MPECCRRVDIHGVEVGCRHTERTFEESDRPCGCGPGHMRSDHFDSRGQRNREPIVPPTPAWLRHMDKGDRK